MKARCPSCGRVPTPLFPCCDSAGIATPAPTVAQRIADVERLEALVELGPKREVLGFEVVRPPGPWGEARGLSLATQVGQAAHSLLMFSGPSVRDEHLPLLERLVALDGLRRNEPCSATELAAVAKAATSRELLHKFPGRLDRLVARGRLPRPS